MTSKTRRETRSKFIPPDILWPTLVPRKVLYKFKIVLLWIKWLSEFSRRWRCSVVNKRDKHLKCRRFGQENISEATRFEVLKMAFAVILDTESSIEA